MARQIWRSGDLFPSPRAARALRNEFHAALWWRKSSVPAWAASSKPPWSAIRLDKVRARSRPKCGVIPAESISPLVVAFRGCKLGAAKVVRVLSGRESERRLM